MKRERLSDILRVTRENAGLSQRQLAIRAGLAQGTVREAELGRDPRHSTLQGYLDALGLSPSRLLPAGSGRLSSPSKQAWTILRDLLGYSVRSASHDVAIDDDRLKTRLTLAGVRSSRFDLRDEEARTDLMRTVFVGASSELGQVQARPRDLDGGRRSFEHGGIRHEWIFAKALGRHGFTYVRTESRELPPRAPTLAGEVLDPSACQALGSFVSVHHPVERFDLSTRLPSAPIPAGPRLLAWPDALVTFAEADELGRLLLPVGAWTDRRDASLRASVRHPPAGLCLALGWTRGGEPSNDVGSRDEPAAGRPETDVVEIGLRLRAAREAEGLSLRALAARMDVSPTTIRKVEAGSDVRHSTLHAYLSVLPGLSAWDLFDLPDVEAHELRRLAWERQRDLFGCEVEDELKELKLGREGSSKILIRTHGLRRLRTDGGDFVVRLGPVRSVLRPSDTALRSVEAGKSELLERSLRISRVKSSSGAPVHQLSIPAAAVDAGVSHARRLVNTGVYLMNAERAREVAGRSANFFEGTTFAPLLPTRRLRIEVQFPRGYWPLDPHARTLARVQLPNSALDDLTTRVHPEGLAVEVDRRRRRLSLVVERPLIGMKYALSWKLP
ncbi:MAG: helix-turn-helix transcriptional regulator [Acidobacteriota bacterium]